MGVNYYLPDNWKSDPSGKNERGNINARMFTHGYRFRLETTTANLMPSNPCFVTTMTEARRERRRLKEFGYRVTIFGLLADGGLSAPLGR